MKRLKFWALRLPAGKAPELGISKYSGFSQRGPAGYIDVQNVRLFLSELLTSRPVTVINSAKSVPGFRYQGVEGKKCSISDALTMNYVFRVRSPVIL
jgi:hypothetical protein